MDDYIKDQVSEDDFLFLETLAKKADKTFTSDVLVHFINAYEDVGKTSIPELPLELALTNSISA